MGDIKRESGLTLVEVIVTMAIFSLVILVSVNMLLFAYKIQARSQHITTVNNEAAQKIEQHLSGVSGIVGTESIKIEFSGCTFDVRGKFFTGDADDDTYRYFKPNDWSY